MDIDQALKAYMKAKHIKWEDAPIVRAQILEGLKQMGLDTSKIDLDKYKEVVRAKKVQ